MFISTEHWDTQFTNGKRNEWFYLLYQSDCCLNYHLSRADRVAVGNYVESQGCLTNIAPSQNNGIVYLDLYFYMFLL